MSKGRGGRPSKDEGEKPTKQIRVFADLAIKLGELNDLNEDSIANIVDPILRPEIEALHKQHEADIERLKRLRQGAKRKATPPSPG